jgi:hypothetical protein
MGTSSRPGSARHNTRYSPFLPAIPI